MAPGSSGRNAPIMCLAPVPGPHPLSGSSPLSRGGLSPPGTSASTSPAAFFGKSRYHGFHCKVRISFTKTGRRPTFVNVTERYRLPDGSLHFPPMNEPTCNLPESFKSHPIFHPTANELVAAPSTKRIPSNIIRRPFSRCPWDPSSVLGQPATSGIQQPKGICQMVSS